LFSSSRRSDLSGTVKGSLVIFTISVVFSPPFLHGAATPPLLGDQKSDVPQGFEIYLKVPEADVIKAVQRVTEDDTIQGSSVYAHDTEVTDAVAENSSKYFGDWKGEGHAFYKVARNALSPRNFKNSADVGTITVRYIVQGVGEDKTRLQIDAVFVEDGGHKVHASDTTVETSEFVEIQARLTEIQKEQRQTAELQERRQKMIEARATSKERDEEMARLNDSETSVKSLEVKVDELHHKVEVRVKSDSADLKAAPFDKATKLAVLPAHTELLVEIITDYWYGVETVEGRRGWIKQDQIEPLP
jgi:hypothetical protein